MDAEVQKLVPEFVDQVKLLNNVLEQINSYDKSVVGIEINIEERNKLIANLNNTKKYIIDLEIKKNEAKKKKDYIKAKEYKNEIDTEFKNCQDNCDIFLKKYISVKLIVEFIYILLLEKNKYYVGKTNNIERRFKEHETGIGASWTKIFKPIKILYSIEKTNDMMEQEWTFKMMARFGIKNVRGSFNCKINLSENDINNIVKSIDDIYDRCFKCHRPGHPADKCKTCNICRKNHENLNSCNANINKKCSECNIAGHMYYDCCLSGNSKLILPFDVVVPDKVLDKAPDKALDKAQVKIPDKAPDKVPVKIPIKKTVKPQIEMLKNIQKNEQLKEPILKTPIISDCVEVDRSNNDNCCAIIIKYIFG